MKCPYCGKILTSSSYNNHKNNTNCLYHRKGIYYCKCEKFATDKYHDFLNHVRGCMSYEYDENKLNRFDFSFEELYRIEKSKVDLYEKILTDLLGKEIKSMISLDTVLKKYKLDEYNEKFVTESEKSEEEYKERKIESQPNIMHAISYQEAFEHTIQSIIEKRIFINPILLSVPNDELESILDLCGYDDYIKLIFCFNIGMIKEGIAYLNHKNIEDLVEYQQSLVFNNPGSLAVAYPKYLFYLTDLSFLRKYLDTVYEKKSDHLDTFVSNVDIDNIHQVFRECYVMVFGDFGYSKELRGKKELKGEKELKGGEKELKGGKELIRIIYNMFLNIVCLDHIVLFYLFISNGKVSTDDIKFTFDSGNQQLAEDKIHILEDIVSKNRT